jgi:isoleucyl-tRNA synthetase
LNVNALERVTSLEGLLDYSVVPNFRALGPKVGKRMPLVKNALTAADGSTVHRALEEHGTLELTLSDGSSVTLGPDDVEVRVRSHEELVLAEDAGYAVALDTTLDDDLRADGIARDFIRAINDRRRELDFDIADRIRVHITATGRVEAAAHRHRDWIARDVLAVEFEVHAGPVDNPTGSVPERKTGSVPERKTGSVPERKVCEIDGVAVALEISRT